MAIPLIVSMQAHRIARKLSSCLSIIGSVQVCLNHASMIWIHWCLSIPHRLVGFVFPANEDYCAMNSIAHSMVPVVTFAGHVSLLVDAFASSDAPFLPYAFHRNNNSRSLSTGNSITLCVATIRQMMWTQFCAIHTRVHLKREKKRENGRNNRKQKKLPYGYCNSLNYSVICLNR